MRKSESTVEIAKALATFQSKVRPVYFDSLNPYYKSKYASLGKVIEAIREVAPELGLSWVQFPVSAQGEVGVETTILHESGEWIAQTILVPLPSEFSLNAKGDQKQANLVQEAGKYITYLRRYSLACAFGLYTEEDNDGNENEYEIPQVAKIVPKSQGKVNKPTNTEKPETVQNKTIKKAERPYTPEQLLANLDVMAERSEDASLKDVQLLVGTLSQICGKDEEERHRLQMFLFGEESIKAVDPKMVSAALAWLKPEWDKGTKEYNLSEYAEQELNLIFEQLNG